MGLPPCHLLSRRSSKFLLCVALCSIFFVTTAVKLHSDVSQPDEVERPGPTQLSNAHYTSSYQAHQKEPKRLQFRLSRRSLNADKGGNQSQSSSNLAVNGKFKLNAYFQEALDRSERRRKWLAGNRRRRAHRNNNVNNPESTSPIYSVLEGEYLVEFLLGTPPQTLSLMMDTGSDLVWVIGDSDHFNAALSSTYRVPRCADLPCSSGEMMLQCQDSVCSFNYGYEDGESTSGVLSYDTVTLPKEGGGQSNLSDFIFGHSNSNTGGFGDFEGVMGLGMGAISFASQVAPQEGSVFSYCLVEWNAPPTVTGRLVFGSDAASSASQFTPIVSSDGGHYLVHVDSITIGGQELAIPIGTFDIQNDGGFIFDSGTTYTYLNAAAYNPLVEAVQAAVSYPQVLDTGTDLLCWDTSDVSNPAFPGVSFAFYGGGIMNLAQDNVFGRITDDLEVYCLLMTQTNDEVPQMIFGNMQQQNRHIVYDIQGQRVGWSHPVQCSSV